MEKNKIGLLQNIYEKFFCPEGRLGRKYFLLMIAGFLVSFVVLFVLAIAAKVTDSTVIGIIAFILVFMIGLMYTLLVNVYGLRRWHDIGHNEKKYLKVWIYPSIIFGLVFGLIPQLGTAGVLGLKIMHIVATVYMLGMMLYICFHSGDRENNDYGPWESRNSLKPYITDRPSGAIPFWASLRSFHGRLNRKRFIMRVGLLGLIAGAVLFTIILLLSTAGQVMAMAMFVQVFPVVIAIPTTALLTQRYHDMGESIRKSLLILGVLLLAAFAMGVLGHIQLFAVILIFFQTFWLVLMAKAVFIKGDEGPNAYGPALLVPVDPVVSAAAIDETMTEA